MPCFWRVYADVFGGEHDPPALSCTLMEALSGIDRISGNVIGPNDDGYDAALTPGIPATSSVASGR